MSVVSLNEYERSAIELAEERSCLAQRQAPVAAALAQAVPRLLPTLLPSHWTTPDARGQLWNIGPAYGR